MGKITFYVELDNLVKKDGIQNIQIQITQAKNASGIQSVDFQF